MPDPAIHVSQWAADAGIEKNDCGPACCAGFIRARGHNVTVNQLAAINPGELTSAEQLQTILSKYNIPSRVDRRKVVSTVAINAEPWSILLVNYAPLRKYAQDTNYTGWHWLIYVGQDPHDPTLSIVLDPDYGLRGLPASEGDHKRYPTEALAAAFRPYSGSTTTAVYVTDIDLSEEPTQPLEIIWTKRYVNSLPRFPKGINVRTGPGKQYSLIGSYNHGDEVEVALGSLTPPYIKTRLGWVDVSFLSEIDPDGQPDWKVRYVKSPFPKGINTRSGPSKDFPVVGSGYFNDTRIEVDMSKVSSSGYVQDKAGLWVAIEFLSELAPEPIPPSAFVTRYVKAEPYLNVRSAPFVDDTTDIKGVDLEYGAEIQVNMSSLTNGFVQMPNRNWVYAAYLDERRPPSPPIPPKPTPEPDPGPGSRRIIPPGVHIVSTQTPHALIWNAIDQLVAAGKMFSAICINTDVGLANALVKVCPNGTMFRMVWDGRELYDSALLSRMSDAEAEKFGWNFYFGAHHHSTWQLDKRIYVKIVNECQYHPRDWAFWLGAMKAADSEGRKLAIFGDSLGTPKTARYDNGVEEWKTRIPALRYAMAHGHVITLNQYSRYKRYDSNPNNLIESEFPVSDDELYEFYGGRHEEFYRIVPPDCRPKLIIGETGPSNSRRSYDTNFIITDMEKYSRKLTTRAFGDRVIGYCYWTLGKWFDNTIDHAAQEIVNLVKRIR